MDAEIFGIHVLTLAVWTIAGMLAGTLFGGGGPGLIGRVILGVAGGLGGGWATQAFNVDLSQHVTGFPPGVSTHIVSFLTALIGALTLLILLRIFTRRKG